MNEKLTILKDLKERLKSFSGALILDVILFGSQLKEQQLLDSDVDVIIVLENDYDWKVENKILELCYEVDLKYNILIDAHIISKTELEKPRGKQPIFTNALAVGLYA